MLVHTRPRRTVRRITSLASTVAVFGLAGGILLLTMTRAATYTAPAEAESAARSGAVSLHTDTGASGGTALLFGIHAPVEVTAFGAVCDGTHDDTARLQAALDATTSGRTVSIPAGKTCRHTAVLKARNAGMRLTGPGTLLATDPQKSALWLDADGIIVDGGLTLALRTPSDRLNTLDHHKLVLNRRAGQIIRNIKIEGSAAAGIFAYGASNYRIEDVTIRDTLADGIHSTFGSHDGTIVRPTVYNPGDDAVAVVSYLSDGVLSRDITVDSPKLIGQAVGRGFSVVGGDRITYRNVYAERSTGAGIYISSEGDPWYTYGSSNVSVLGGTLIDSDTYTPNDHGAVLLPTYNTGQVTRDILIRDIRIINTNPLVSRQVGILSLNGGTNRRIQLLNFTITGGNPNLLTTTGTSPSEYNTSGWTYNGQPVAPHTGFTP